MKIMTYWKWSCLWESVADESEKSVAIQKEVYFSGLKGHSILQM